MAPTEELCDACSSIPFDAEDPPFGETRAELEGNILASTAIFKLGSLEQISSRRSCPVCKLITIATARVQRIESRRFGQDQEIGLRWRLDSTVASACWNFQLLFFGVGPSRSVSVCFVHNPDVDRPQPSCYFVKDTRPQLDFARVRTWLSGCEESHPSCYQSIDLRRKLSSAYSGLKVLRFIDVKRGCIVEKRRACRYVTLSYVWGTLSTLRLSAANKKRMMEPGSLHDAWHLLPRTIQDAITLVDRLGEKYLWVDALCLIQNDSDDVQAGVDVMNLIYQHSVFTIAAACGRDSNAGLPGVETGTRIASNHFEEIKPGLSLGLHTSLETLLESTTYNTRAWTLQERMLSPRVLYFVDDRVYFRCHEGIKSEDCLDSATFEVTVLSREHTPGVLSPAMIRKCPESTWRQILRAYTNRALTDQTDVLRALTGIMKRFSETTTDVFFQGMPVQHLDSIILFRGAQLPLRRREGFPSYSWVGWIGPVAFFPLRTPRSRPWSSGGDQSSQAPAAYTTIQDPTWVVECTWIAWYARTMTRTYKLIAGPTSRERQGYFYDLLRDRPPALHTRPRRDLPRPQGRVVFLPSYPLLQFWTLTVYFRVSEKDAFSGRCFLVDIHGRQCGSFQIDNFGDVDVLDGQELEFAVLSMTQASAVDIVRGAPTYSCTAYFIMCLEWSDGIAERRGMGMVVEQSLVRSLGPGPEWKEIVLA